MLRFAVFGSDMLRLIDNEAQRRAVVTRRRRPRVRTWRKDA